MYNSARSCSFAAVASSRNDATMVRHPLSRSLPLSLSLMPYLSICLSVCLSVCLFLVLLLSLTVTHATSVHHANQNGKRKTGNGMERKVRRSFRVLCRSSLSVATAMVHAVRAGTPPQDILADASDSGHSGGGSSRHGSSSKAGHRRRRGGAAGEGQQYPALVERALETLLKVMGGQKLMSSS